LSRGEIEPVYYLFGSEPRLRDEALAAIRSALFGEGGGADVFNIDAIDARQRSAAEIIDAANQLPMGAPRRLIVVRGAESLIRAGASDGGHAFASYLANPSPTTCLVLLGEKPDLRLRAARSLAALGALWELGLPKDQRLAVWLEEEARRLGKRLGSRAAEKLVALTGNDLTVASMELEKLVVFVGDRDEIQGRDVEEAVGDRSGAGIWEFTDAVKRRDAAGALWALDRYLGTFRRPEDALFPLLGTLRGELGLLLHAREGRETRGLSGKALAGELSQALDVHPFRAEKAVAASVRFSRAEIETALQRLLAVDRRLKTSAVPARLLLDAWVWEFCGVESVQSRA
jgi:DNA polymerase-3 subunit delta